MDIIGGIYMDTKKYEYCDPAILEGYEKIKNGTGAIQFSFHDYSRFSVEKRLNERASMGFYVIDEMTVDAYRTVRTTTYKYTDGTSTSTQSTDPIHFNGEVIMSTPYSEKEMKKIVENNDTYYRSLEEEKELKTAYGYKTRQEKGKKLGGASIFIIVTFIVSLLLAAVFGFLFFTSEGGKEVLAVLKETMQYVMESGESVSLDASTLNRTGVIYLFCAVAGITLAIIFGFLSIVFTAKDGKDFKTYKAKYADMTAEEIAEKKAKAKDTAEKCLKALPYFAKPENQGKYYKITDRFFQGDNLEIINNETGKRKYMAFYFKRDR